MKIRRRPGNRAAAGVLVAAVMLAAAFMTLAGCGSGSNVYTHREPAFKFRYPAGWDLREDLQIGATSGGDALFSVGVFDPDGTQVSGVLVDGVVCSVYQLDVTVESSMMNELRAEVEDVLAGLARQQAGLTTLKGLTKAEVGGLPGFKTTLSFPRDGATLVTTLYFLFAGNLEYQLIVQANDRRWDELAPELDIVLSSFAVAP